MDVNERLVGGLGNPAHKKMIEFGPGELGEPTPLSVGREGFYQADVIKPLLFAHNGATKLGRTDFIDYDAYKDYYPHDKKKHSLYYHDQEKEVEFPFKEDINFIRHPHTHITVKNIGHYTMPSDLAQLTAPALRAFLAKKPKTYDGPNLRLASLRKTSAQRYECRLERASYFPQICTNLSVDYRIEKERYPTLRLLDMDEAQGLRPFEQSMLVNTLGTSAVVYYRIGGQVYFFMRLRKQLGIYENMFGTTSGEVENPHEGGEPKELISFVAEEMKREFAFETGLNPSKVVKRVLPLALTRDLIRGGKPQFFFLIEISAVHPDDFSPAFKKSIEGLDEFHNDLIHKRRFFSALSPEFALNLFYAFQALLAEKRLADDPSVLNLNHLFR